MQRFIKEIGIDMIYIIKQADKILAFFHNDVDIVYKTFLGSRWSDEHVVLDNAMKNFSINISRDNSIYVFCGDSEGNIVLCVSEKDSETWSKKIMLSVPSDKNQLPIFFPMISDTLSLIYNSPTDNTLLIQNMNFDNTWQPPTILDKVSGNFKVQNISHDHALVFYQSVSKDNKPNIGYIEVSPHAYSKNFKTIYSSPYPTVDTSFLTTYDKIYALYITKNMFGNQLFFKKIDDNGISNPILVYENQRIEICLLSIVNNQLTATFKSRGQLLISTSNDDGESFTKPTAYKNKICSDLKKATFICENPMSTADFFTREVYVDEHAPWDIQVLPDLCNNFFDIPKIEKIISPPPPDTAKDEQINYMTELIKQYKHELDELKQDNTLLEKKLLALQKPNH